MPTDPEPPIIGGGSKRLCIFQLPEEIQKEIVSHCSQNELICLSLVSRQFRELAAAQLYRHFHIVFPDEDDPSFDSPIDGLAGGLDTFVTSEYNYAQHLRYLSLDTLSCGEKAEYAYKPYLANVSCGKFLNTLMLLTLRKARALDRFKWNIRVELNRPVYEALFKIQSLRHLHIRLQAGPSLYEVPPPLPFQTPESAVDAAPVIPQWGNHSNSSLVPLFGPPPSLLPPPPVLKSTWANRNPKKAASAKQPPTLSGFRNLQTLSILDVDDLEIINELRTCIQQSKSTLRKLRLSFSDALANRARRPCLDATDDESDADDEFQVVPLPTTLNDASGPAKIFRAEEERKRQELILGRIFQVEPVLAKKEQWLNKKSDKKIVRLKIPELLGKRELFINSIELLATSLIKHVHGTSSLSNLEQQQMLEIIVEASRKYGESEYPGPKNTPTSSAKDHTPGATAASNDGITPASNKPDSQIIETEEVSQGAAGKAVEGARAVDIDITIPEDRLEVEPIGEPGDDEYKGDVSPPRSPSIATDPKGAQDTTPADTDNAAPVGKTQDEFKSATPSATDIQHELNIIEAEISEDKGEGQSAEVDDEELRQRASEYGTATRGIGLQSLRLSLVPIKASVLGRAIDLHTLKRITFLNVGSQAPFWMLMKKENQLRSLPLRKIYTDNVSLPFLQLVAELDWLDELFLLERRVKHKPESLAPKSKTTIEQIRRLVLKKHMHTIKRLMIKNNEDSSWDVDPKTTRLICRQGKMLEEIAVMMGMNSVHTFIQYISALVNLRALQLVTFRHDDTCVTVMRETRRFIVDAVSHHPELKLEWIAIGDTDGVTRITRERDAPKPTKKGTGKDTKKGKGKMKASDVLGPLMNAGPFPVLPTEGWSSENDSDEEDATEFLRGLKMDLTEGIQFYDVFGVRIFKKEIMAGRL